MKEKIKLIKEKIKDDLNDLNEEKIELFFDRFKNDKTFSFIKYYNKTVLDKERISFGEFISWRNWAIRSMSQKTCTYFDENYDKFIEEIKRDRDIKSFFKKYCCRERREVSFCSKLFHTVLPDEYPPVDSHVRETFKKFKLPSDITGVLIIKKAYEDSIKNDKDKIDIIRKILSKDKFSEFRVDKLSNMRILDMFYWYRKSAY